MSLFNRQFSFFCLVLCIAILLISCSSHSEGGDFSALLDEVDSFVAMGESDSALDLLKDLEKNAYSSAEYLGVYKRYRNLGETTKAEKILKKSVKKIKDSEELNAVYSVFLLRSGNENKALKFAKKLSNGKYAGIYAETFLKKAINSELSADEIFSNSKKHKNQPNLEDNYLQSRFYDERFCPIYQDAARSSKNPTWLWNAASIFMIQGQNAKAQKLYPDTLASLRDSLFWGKIFFDSESYSDSLEALSSYSDFSDGKTYRDFSYLVEHQALLADVLYILGEDAESENTRSRILDAVEKQEKYLSLNSSSSILPLLYVNSVQYAQNRENVQLRYDRLQELLTLFPTYTSGLASYAEFALDTMRLPPEDKLKLQLRAVGLRTQSMEAYDAIPKVSVEDALQRIENALQDEKTPALIVLREELLSELNKTDENSVKVARIWEILEQNEIGSSLYPSEIMRYCITVLLNCGFFDDAKTLFDRHIVASYNNLVSEGEEFNIFDHIDSLLLWECEFAGFFALKSGRYNEGQKIYNYILDKYSGRNPIFSVSGQNEVISNALVNLGTFYAGCGQRGIAQDYFSKAIGRLVDGQFKAEVLYRSGEASFYQREYRSAMRSLQYALVLNPTHNKSKRLLRQVQAELNKND